jgi:hypothetical protein
VSIAPVWRKLRHAELQDGLTARHQGSAQPAVDGPVPPRRIVLALAALVCLAVPATARADALAPPAGQVLTGLSGGYSLSPFEGQTGVKPGVFGVFVTWGSLGEYVFRTPEAAGTRLMMHLSTTNGYGPAEKITPLGIARGGGDAYLLRLNRRIAEYGRPTYVRFLAEMNQVNNAYAAFNRDGSSRGPAHATEAYKQAWRRATLILRGGPVAAIDAQLAALRLPAVRGVAPAAVLPQPPVAMAWVPQTRGTPDIPRNLPAAYWPGSKYVDWVGTDFYSRFPRFDWLSQFYDHFRGKPFVFGEWALWGSDDAGFVKRLFGWIGRHRRVRMVLYNQGGLSDGPFRLNRYPRARAELRRQLKKPRYR